MKKILIVGDANSMYIHELVRSMKHYGEDLQIDVFTTKPTS